jgi:hypothetical protein
MTRGDNQRKREALKEQLRQEIRLEFADEIEKLCTERDAAIEEQSLPSVKRQIQHTAELSNRLIGLRDEGHFLVLQKRFRDLTNEYRGLRSTYDSLENIIVGLLERSDVPEDARKWAKQKLRGKQFDSPIQAAAYRVACLNTSDNDPFAPVDDIGVELFPSKSYTFGWGRE